MYTKKELQDLVAYCKARGIQVLPEVEMPGHNMAPVSYTHLMLPSPRTGHSC